MTLGMTGEQGVVITTTSQHPDSCLLQVLQEAMGRATVDLAEMKQKLVLSEAESARQAAQAMRAAAVDGGAVTQLHALKTKVAGETW